MNRVTGNTFCLFFSLKFMGLPILSLPESVSPGAKTGMFMGTNGAGAAGASEGTLNLESLS